jgi:uncharacterized coiled-coil DUF342 family protein
MGLGRIMRPFSTPLRTFFDRRFEGVLQRVDAGREEAGARERYAYGRHQEMQNELATLYRLLRADMDATNDAVDLRARGLAEIAGSSEAILEQLAELREAVFELASRLETQGQDADRLEERRASDSH